MHVPARKCAPSRHFDQKATPECPIGVATEPKKCVQKFHSEAENEKATSEGQIEVAF
jgi:hypothetical protein